MTQIRDDSTFTSNGGIQNLRPQDKAPGLLGLNYTNILVNKLILLLFIPFVFVFFYLCASKEAPSDNRRAQCMPRTILK